MGMNKVVSLLRHRENSKVISSLNDAIERIKKQEEDIGKLEERLCDKKNLLKKELMVSYDEMEKAKDYYISQYLLAPFHMTKQEHRDYEDFKHNHNEDCEDFYEEDIIFHFYSSKYKRSIEVECPKCHKKRKLDEKREVNS